MNIYYVANVRMPTTKAHGIQLAKMCEGFIESGNTLTLFLPKQKNASPVDPQEFYGLRVPLPLISVPVIWFRTSRFGFNLTALSFAVTSFFTLWRARLPKDAVLYSIDLDQFSFFLLPLLGRPLFLEIHGTKRNTFFTRFAFKRARGFIAVGAGVKESLMRTFGISAERIVVCPNGIDPQMFLNLPSGADARRELGLPLSYAIFLYMGRFYDWKGLEVLPKAAHVLGARGGIYCVGGSAEELQGAIRAKYLPSNLICVGWKNHAEIPLWLAAADFLLVTATKKNDYSYRETSPMKLFEYMAARRPVVAADTPAIRSVITEKEALFYEPDDADDLSLKITYALEHKAELAEKAEAGYRKALGFSWKKRAAAAVNFMQHQ